MTETNGRRRQSQNRLFRRKNGNGLRIQCPYRALVLTAKVKNYTNRANTHVKTRSFGSVKPNGKTAVNVSGDGAKKQLFFQPAARLGSATCRRSARRGGSCGLFGIEGDASLRERRFHKLRTNRYKEENFLTLEFDSTILKTFCSPTARAGARLVQRRRGIHARFLLFLYPTNTQSSPALKIKFFERRL